MRAQFQLVSKIETTDPQTIRLHTKEPVATLPHWFGNYNMGVKEQIIFPEIEYEKIDALRGMNITITTSAKTDEEAKALLLAFKLPLKK